MSMTLCEISMMTSAGTSLSHQCRRRKGKILDSAVERSQPHRLLELGSYRGDSALRMARVMPLEARLYSVELNAANAEIARGILTYAGVDDRVTVVGTLGDGGETIRTLKRENGFTQGSLDLVFIDHDKNDYLPDLELILDEGYKTAPRSAVDRRARLGYSDAHRGKGA
jgi:catechol O-methyltransferase